MSTNSMTARHGVRPVPNKTTQFFWDGVQASKLLILRCTDCAHLHHPPTPVCPRCLSEALTPEEMSGSGQLYSWTVVNRSFHPFWDDKLPYIIGRVELAEQPGLTMLGPVVDCEESSLRIGLPLEVTFRSIGDDDFALPLFRPVVETQ